MDGLHGTLEDIIRTLDAPSSYSESSFHKHNRYSEHLHYSDSDDDEDDELVRNMFSGTMESSSEEDYSDEYDADDQFNSQSANLHFRGAKLPTEGDRVQDIADGDLEELPSWFLWQTFQYSRLMVLPLLSGAPVVLFMGGEMLLAVIALGALITHLLYDAGLAKGASSACMMATVCAIIVVGYNLTPLVIWRSSWYVILLAAALGYLALTGAWILLLMKDFCRNDPHLTLYLESMLFTVYPSASVILSTWFISMMIGCQFSHYVLLITGFLFYRVFVQPFASSFVEDEAKDESKRIIIDGWSSAGLLFLLMVAPSMLYLTTSWYSVATRAAFIPTAMNVITLLAISCFVTTFLHLKPILEVFDVSMEKVVLLRKLAVTVSIISGTLALHFHGYQSMLLPHWPLVFLCAWSVLGLALSKNQKVQGMIFTVNLLILTVIVMLQMPWSLNYTIGHSGWNVQTVYIAILADAMLCYLIVYGSRYMSLELFSWLNISHSIVFSHLVSLFHQSQLTSTTALILVHMFCVYFIIRMQHVKKLVWQCALISVAVHLTSLSVALETAYFLPSQNLLPCLLHICVVFMLTVLLVYITVMEKSEVISTSKFIKYISSVLVLSIVCVCQQQKLLSSISLYQKSSHVLLTLGLSSVITSLPALKLSVYHRAENDITWKFGPSLVVIGFTLLTVQPTVTADMFDVVRLLLFQSVLSGCVLIAVIHRVKSSVTLYLLCLLTGSSLGALLYSLMFSSLSATGWVIYGAQLSLWLSIGVTCLKPTVKLERHLFILSLATVLLAVIMFLTDMMSHHSVAGPGRVCAAGGLLVVAAAAKFHSIMQLPQLSKDTTHQSHMPTTGNISAVVCLCVLLSLTQQVRIPSDLWMLASTGVLFLLQKDDRLIVLRNLNRKNHVVPSVVTIITLLVMSIMYQSPLLDTSRGFLSSLCATLEFIILLVSLPVFLVLTIVLWHGHFYTLPWWKSSSQVMVVLYLTPFFFCLILTPVSTTYRSWVYAVLGIASGTYLWQTKIPLSIL